MKRAHDLVDSSRSVYEDSIDLEDTVNEAIHHSGPERIELSEYVPRSWLTREGSCKMQEHVMRDLPDLIGAQLITLTIDQGRFAGPEEAFEATRPEIRKFFDKLKRGVQFEGQRYEINAPYATKVEFHENGWAHFHIVVLTRREIPAKLIKQLWKYGHTDRQTITGLKQVRYLLKPPMKGLCFPSWALNRKKLRIWQPSQSFKRPTGDQPSATRPRTNSEGRFNSPRRSFTIGQRILRWAHSGSLRIGGRFHVIRLAAPFRSLWAKLEPGIQLEGRELGLRRVAITSVEDFLPWVSPAKEI